MIDPNINLVKFLDSDGDEVYINPKFVIGLVRVNTYESYTNIYMANDVKLVFKVIGFPAQVAKALGVT